MASKNTPGMSKIVAGLKEKSPPTKYVPPSKPASSPHAPTSTKTDIPSTNGAKGTGGGQPSTQPSTPVKTETKTYPVGYSKELGGYVSSTGKFYPTNNPLYVPKGEPTQTKQENPLVATFSPAAQKKFGIKEVEGGVSYRTPTEVGFRGNAGQSATAPIVGSSGKVNVFEKKGVVHGGSPIISPASVPTRQQQEGTSFKAVQAPGATSQLVPFQPVKKSEQEKIFGESPIKKTVRELPMSVGMYKVSGQETIDGKKRTYTPYPPVFLGSQWLGGVVQKGNEIGFQVTSKVIPASWGQFSSYSVSHKNMDAVPTIPFVPEKYQYKEFRSKVGKPFREFEYRTFPEAGAMFIKNVRERPAEFWAYYGLGTLFGSVFATSRTIAMSYPATSPYLTAGGLFLAGSFAASEYTSIQQQRAMGATTGEIAGEEAFKLAPMFAGAGVGKRNYIAVRNIKVPTGTIEATKFDYGFLKYEKVQQPTYTSTGVQFAFETFPKELGAGKSPRSYPLAFRPAGGVKWTIGEFPKLTNVPVVRGDIEPYIPQSSTEREIFYKNVEQFITKPSKGETGIIPGKSVSVAEQAKYIRTGIDAAKQFETNFYDYINTGRESSFLKKTSAGDYTLQTETVGIQNLPFGEKTSFKTKAFSPKITREFNVKLAQKGFIRFGSSATGVQLLPEVSREIGDIDVFFNTRLEPRLGYKVVWVEEWFREKGVKVRWADKDPFVLEAKTSSGWVKAAEFKGIGVGAGQQAPPMAYGFDLDVRKGTRTIGREKIASLNAEGARKLAAAFMISQEGALGVKHSGRTKDVPDFARIIYTGYKQAQAKGLPTSAMEAYLKQADLMGIEYKSPVSIKPNVNVGSTTMKFTPFLNKNIIRPDEKVAKYKAEPLSYKNMIQGSSKQSLRPSQNLFQFQMTTSVKQGDFSYKPKTFSGGGRSPSSSSAGFKSSVSSLSGSPLSLYSLSSSSAKTSPSRVSSVSSKSPYSMSPVSPYLYKSPSSRASSKSSASSISSYFSSYSSSSSSSASSSSYFTPPPPPSGYFPNLGGLSGGFTSKGRGGKRKYAYRPTLRALVFNIKGKAPKSLTGYEERPLPKGGFKLPF